MHMARAVITDPSKKDVVVPSDLAHQGTLPLVVTDASEASTNRNISLGIAIFPLNSEPLAPRLGIETPRISSLIGLIRADPAERPRRQAIG